MEPYQGTAEEVWVNYWILSTDSKGRTSLRSNDERTDSIVGTTVLVSIIASLVQ